VRNLSQKLHCIRVSYKNTFAVGTLQERVETLRDRMLDCVAVLDCAT
jgi:hypothetical protein